MSDLIKILKDKGCDMDGALNRFLNDEDLYSSCYEKVMVDPAFEKLGEAIKEKNAEEGFHQAHTLKGVIANMGITPIYDIVVELVEPLRVGEVDGLDEKFNELLAKRDEFKTLL